MTRFSRMSTASSTSTVSRELTSPKLYPSIPPPGYVTVPQDSDDAGPGDSSAALNRRNTGNDAAYSLLGLTSASVVQVASFGLAESAAVVEQVSAHSTAAMANALANP